MDAAVTPLTPANAAAELAERELADAVQTPMQRLKALPARKKWMAGLGLVGLLVALLLLMQLNKPDSMAPLFRGELSDKDAGAVLAQLDTLQVPYKIKSDGSIMVPAERANALRMKLALMGLPKSSSAGAELLDKQRFGQSSLQEHTTLRMAMQADLERTIGALPMVQAVRVHLALPEQRGFYREQAKPSASVALTLHPGRVLDKGQVAGIVHLVSSSVPELNPKAVSVIDQDSTLLSQTADGDRQDLTQQQRAHVQYVEKKLLERVNEILEPALGRDNLRATVTADIDFNQVETTAEAYRPNQTPETAAIRSQSNLETSGPGQILPTGVPGAASNQPPTSANAPITGASQPLQPAQAGTAGGGTKRHSQINYEVDRRVDVTRNAVGTIKRINVAVLVNHRMVTDAKGKSTAQPLPQEERDKLTALVQEAVGYSKDRGDSVTVATIPFRAEPKPEEPPLWKQPWALEMLKTAAVPTVMLLVALLLIFMVIRPALAKEKPPEPPPEAGLDAVVDDPEALPAPEDEMAADDPESPEKLRILADAREMAKANPLGVANILRSWMNPDEAKK
ncbi:flagellar basal-body MS-ring/collar protein FliF [Ideonella sp. DXS22W]|uniref:Flagellar M-ring protein n=1 Tax=Pseudaquabacterium inlustre TaxID=2984192 RepID=A0ABU9CAN6_9BURK